MDPATPLPYVMIPAATPLAAQRIIKMCWSFEFDSTENTGGTEDPESPMHPTVSTVPSKIATYVDLSPPATRLENEDDDMVVNGSSSSGRLKI